VLVEDVTVQKEQGTARLMLRRCAHLPASHQRREKAGDLVIAHLQRMALALKQDKPLDSADVCLPRSHTIVLHPHRLPSSRFCGSSHIAMSPGYQDSTWGIRISQMLPAVQRIRSARSNTKSCCIMITYQNDFQSKDISVLMNWRPTIAGPKILWRAAIGRSSGCWRKDYPLRMSPRSPATRSTGFARSRGGTTSEGPRGWRTAATVIPGPPAYYRRLSAPRWPLPSRTPHPMAVCGRDRRRRLG
jgi:hypothetical protein